MVNLLPFLGFCLLTYQDVSAYFGKMGVLSFTRQLKRSRWYLKRVASLYGSAFLYWTVYLIVGVFVILYLHEPPVMELDVLAYCIVDGLLTFVLFSCFLSLLVNLLSIRLGSAQSLVAVTVGVAVLSFALGFVFDGYLTDLYIQYPQLNSGMIDSTKYVQLPLWLTIFLYLNPMSHVLMNFHNPPSYFIFLSQNVPALQGESNHLPSWWGSLLILLLLNALAVGMGWMYLRKKDITPIEGK